MATYTLGLIGYPLGHSLSPRLHTAALQACGLDGEYRLYPVNPVEEGMETLRGLLEEVRLGHLQGLNVTIPHKQSVLPFMDHLSPTAQAVRAVNTIFCRDGELVGENTDVGGFLADLAKKISPLTSGKGIKDVERLQGDRQSPKEALVLGAGGSARAVVYALCQAGWRVIIAARRLEQARELAAAFSEQNHLVSGRELSRSSLKELVSQQDVRLILNATPLGMYPDQEASPWPADLSFPGQAFVYDLVYNPPETRLIKQARQAGIEAVNGLGMLLEQAVLSFELWTGVRPEVEVLRKVLYS